MQGFAAIVFFLRDFLNMLLTGENSSGLILALIRSTPFKESSYKNAQIQTIAGENSRFSVTDTINVGGVLVEVP